MARNISCDGVLGIWEFPLQAALTIADGTPWEAWLPGLVTFLAGLIFYFGWIKPVNIRVSLLDTGFGHLKDGTYRSVEHSVMSKRELVQAFQRRRAIGEMPPVFPNGWFCLLESADVPSGQVRHVAALGENFAVFRTEKGEIHILDAYCPHLGANMALGGKVHGDCLECPFHKWRFSGATGACTMVPYSKGAPPAAEAKRWPSREINHFIFVWYHAEREEPTWEIERRSELETGEWCFHGRTEILAMCHIEEILENGADIGHLDAIHSQNIMAGVDARFWERKQFQFINHVWDAAWEVSAVEKHKGLLTITSDTRAFGKLSLAKVSANVQQIGPGLVELNLLGPLGPMLLVMSMTPIEPLLVRVVHRIYAPAVTGPFTRLILYMETGMFQRDVAMWNHKKYLIKPHLVKEDGAIARHRRWFHQFYSEHSYRLQFQKDTLDW